MLLAAETMAGSHRVFQASGDVTSAARTRERLRSLAARCPAASTAALELNPAFDALTPRQRHIATLAATPMSSPHIARRLHISVRTVDNHLARVYAKLGIASRVELSALLSHAASEAS